MKCISLWQPWATLIAIGAKRFETRSWSTNHFGPILIHAAKKWNAELARTCLDSPFSQALGLDKSPGDLKLTLPFGAIVAVANLMECYEIFTDCLKAPMHKGARNLAPLPTGNERSFGDYYPGRFAWQLLHIRRFPNPIPFKGAQGIFSVPDELVAEQLAKAVAIEERFFCNKCGYLGPIGHQSHHRSNDASLGLCGYFPVEVRP